MLGAGGFRGLGTGDLGGIEVRREVLLKDFTFGHGERLGSGGGRRLGTRCRVGDGKTVKTGGILELRESGMSCLTCER